MVEGGWREGGKGRVVKGWRFGMVKGWWREGWYSGGLVEGGLVWWRQRR